MQTIMLGGGCVWCTESVFSHVKGVQEVTSGYMGGEAVTANYQAVCRGDTGHIEVIKVVFDDTVIPLEVVLGIFFATHDPTTQDRQGNDVGRQYASVIFYSDEALQKPTIDRVIAELRDQQGMNLVTEVHPAQVFYAAEAYHQNFYANNPTQSYCNFVIPPKLAKLKHYFGGFVVDRG